jgi:hypothetical protein
MTNIVFAELHGPGIDVCLYQKDGVLITTSHSSSSLLRDPYSCHAHSTSSIILAFPLLLPPCCLAVILPPPSTLHLFAPMPRYCIALASTMLSS